MLNWDQDLQMIKNWREESIKTRIETPHPVLIMAQTSSIEEKNPLKQGLKHEDGIGTACDENDWREESIKTRIETSMMGVAWLSLC